MLILYNIQVFSIFVISFQLFVLIICFYRVFVVGIPPLVSRRVLETLTYLARNHLRVAKLMLHIRLPHVLPVEPENHDHSRGKAIMVIQENENQPHGEYLPIELLLSLLNQPLYLRSVAHLEQVMQ